MFTPKQFRHQVPCLIAQLRVGFYCGEFIAAYLCDKVGKYLYVCILCMNVCWCVSAFPFLLWRLISINLHKSLCLPLPSSFSCISLCVLHHHKRLKLQSKLSFCSKPLSLETNHPPPIHWDSSL